MKNIKIYAILFTLLLLVAAIASFAWFYNMDQVSIESSNNMNIQVGSGLEISLHGSDTWGSSLVANRDKVLLDCSGNGVAFYAPTKLDEKDKPIGDLTQLSSFDGYIMDTFVDIRSTNNVDIYLGSKSAIIPMDGEGTTSTFGDFSTGHIAGCVRVAFFEVSYGEDGEPVIGTPICVWAPNSKTQLSFDENGDPSVSVSGTAEEKYSYYSSANATTDYTENDMLNGKFITAEGSALCTADAEGSTAVNSSPRLLSFAPKNGETQTKHLLVRVWFEGTDRESSYVLNGGKVSYNFSLVGVVPKGEESAESLQQLQALTLEGTGDAYSFTPYASGMYLYSLDGKEWSTLGSNKSFTGAEARSGIYVRLAETATTVIGKTVIKKTAG